MIFGEYRFLNTVYKILFSQIKIIKYKKKDIEELVNNCLFSLRRHKDSVVSYTGSNRRNVRKMVAYETKIKEEHSSILKKSKTNSISSIHDDDDFFEKQTASRIENLEKHFKTAYQRNTKISSKISTDSNSFTKASYEKIIFNITTTKYMRREQKILEVNNSGIFNIYKKGKVNKIFYFRMIVF